jgi:hypothetical protein
MLMFTVGECQNYFIVGLVLPPKFDNYHIKHAIYPSKMHFPKYHTKRNSDDSLHKI